MDVYIALTRGLATIVSAEDSDFHQAKWVALSVGNNKFYAARSVKVGDTNKTVLLHRLILSRMISRDLLSKEEVDHINNNPLDNRRENLRLATHAQNNMNKGLQSNNTSGYKGVYWDSVGKRWYAQIYFKGKATHLGRFDTPEEAYEAYCKAAKEVFGEYARISMTYQIMTAGQAPKYFKTIVTGTSGAGKTRFGLDGGTFEITKDGKLKGNGEFWPDLLVIDSEGGISPYEESMSGRFRVIHTNKITEYAAIVNDILSGKLVCGTLMVDTHTTFYQIVREAAELQSKGEMSFKEWGKVNRTMQSIQNKLAMLPCHVILVVHETEVIETGKGETRVQGVASQDGKVKLSANKTLSQWADVILWMQPRVGKNSQAKVHKARGLYLGEDSNLMLENPSWQKTFKPIAERWASRGGDTVKLDDELARQDAQAVIDENESEVTVKASKTTPVPPQTFANENAVKRWIQKWLRAPYSLSPEQVAQFLGVEKFGDESLKSITFEEADRAILDALEAKVNS